MTRARKSKAYGFGSEDETIRWALSASDEEVGPACMNVLIWPTIADDDQLREVYCQGARHALAAVRRALGVGRRMATLSDDDRLVLVGGLRRLRRAHHESEDCWYSCPKSGQCCDDRQSDCNCGADVNNALVEELLSILAGSDDHA